MSAPCRVRRGKGYEACDDEAVYLCCTFPEVAFGGRYPLSLPCGARTFLTGGPFAPSARLSSLLAKDIVPDFTLLVKSMECFRLKFLPGWDIIFCLDL